MEEKQCAGPGAKTAARREKLWKKRLVRYACNFVSWTGIVALGLLALPVGLTILLICAAWSLGDWLAACVHRRGARRTDAGGEERQP